MRMSGSGTSMISGAEPVFADRPDEKVEIMNMVVNKYRNWKSLRGNGSLAGADSINEMDSSDRSF